MKSTDFISFIGTLYIFCAFPVAKVSLLRQPSAIHRNLNKFIVRDFINRDDRQLMVTSTVTETKIEKTTKFTTLAVACAKFVNVSSACRRQRNRWIDEPIVLSFDDATDKLVDILYTPVLSRMMETTKVNQAHHGDQEQGNNEHTNRLVGSLQDVNDDEPRHPRIFFREIFDLMGRYFPRRTSSSQSTTTITVTKSKTQTFTEPITTTNTFFIQGCTPSPFPFKECSRGHKHNSSSTALQTGAHFQFV